MRLKIKQLNSSILFVAALSGVTGSLVGLLDAFVWITFVSQNSPAIGIYSSRLALLLTLYAMGGYGILSFVIAFIYFSVTKNKINNSPESRAIAVSLPIALYVAVLGLGYLHGGLTQSVFYISGCLFLALFVFRRIYLFLKRRNILVTFNKLLLFHGIILACILVVVAYRFASSGWKWLSILLSSLLIVVVFIQLFRKSSQQKAVLGFLINAVLLAMLLFIPTGSQPFKPLGQLPRIVLITIDTLRPDHLGYYGYKSAHTPNIDAIASKGVVFKNTYAPAPRTGPSHISILTGLYPNHHGAVQNYMWLSEGTLSLPEILSSHGYKTAAFISGFPLTNESSGLAHHFDFYYDDLSTISFIPEVVTKLRLFNLVNTFGSKLSYKVISNERKASWTTELVLNWLDANKDQQFFLWVHYFDPHIPYQPPLKYRNVKIGSVSGDWYSYSAQERENFVKHPEIIQQEIDFYDGEISYVDAQIGQIVKTLNDWGIMKNTLLIITADHGESLGEHNYYFAHGDLYNTCLKIPLVFFYPSGKLKHQIISNDARLIDITPTILDILDIKSDFSFDGRSLFPLFNNQETVDDDQMIFASVLKNHQKMYCVKDHNYKLIWNSATWSEQRNVEYEELYDLQRDPNETINLIESKPVILPTMRRALKTFRDTKMSLRTQIDNKTRKRLKSLGYIR